MLPTRRKVSILAGAARLSIGHYTKKPVEVLEFQLAAPPVINLRRACATRVAILGRCVCLSVTTFSATTCYKPAKKRHQRVPRYTGLIKNWGF